MALSVIIILYVSVGILAAAGSIFISQRVFSAKGEQIFFALFLVAIAAFYLAFTAYFGDQRAWRLETGAVIVFSVFGILGLRLPVVLIIGYCLHGIWDIIHEIDVHSGTSLFGAQKITEIPLAYGFFLRSLRLVYSRLFLHSAAGVEYALEGAWPLTRTHVSNVVMARLAVMLSLMLFLSQLASAKRIAPAKVDPIVYEGIRYVAPNDDGRRGYIEAWDVATEKKLWELTIFTNRIDPKLEEDVQWVFINALNIREGRLIATSEHGENYQVDLKTKEITQLDSPSSPSPGAIGDVPEVVKKALTNASAGKKYDLSSRIKPSYLEGDFNGDGKAGRGGFGNRALDGEGWNCHRSWHDWKNNNSRGRH